MKQETTNTAIHDDVMGVIDAANRREQFGMAKLLSFLPEGALSDQDKQDADGSDLEIDYDANTFRIVIPGDHQVDLKFPGGHLDMQSARGTVEIAPDRVAFDFPNNSQSPRGRFAIFSVRLKSIALTRTTVDASLDKGDYIVRHA